MKNWSIKKKLGFLSFWLLAMICVVGFIGARGTSRITARLNGIVDVNLPAVHTVALLNSVDDELRTAAYRAIIANAEKDRDGLQKAEAEFNQFRDGAQKYLDKMQHLGLEADAKKAVEEVAPLMKAYVGSVEQVLQAAREGRHAVAIAKVTALQQEFEALDAKLDVLEQKVVELSDGDKQTAQADGTFYSRLSGTIVFVSLFMGLFLAYWIVRELTSTLSGIIDRLSESSGKVSYASTQSSRTASSLSESATEQAAGLQETMASAEEISAMVNQNAESANRAKTAVDQSERDSVHGAQSVAEMLSAIAEIKRTNDEILGQMEESNREFGNIVKIIGEIEDKTKVINDIVFQTKLLSFNASVEAARAGEHGKGFAVVAEEVGNLAQMSGNAAKEITDMLGNSVKRVNEIVEQTTRKVDSLVEVGRDKIAQGQLTAQRCRDVLDQIAKSAKTVSGMVAEISAASKEQAQGVSEINKAIAQLDQVTQNNSAVSQESATQAGQLEAEANHLLEAVSRLAVTVRGGGARAAGPTESTAQAKAKSSAKEAPKSVAKAKAPAAQTNVIPMARPKSGPAPSAKSASAAKRVVGGPEVPSGDDPNFEEF